MTESREADGFPLLKLPENLIFKILKFMDLETILKISSCSKDLYKYIDANRRYFARRKLYQVRVIEIGFLVYQLTETSEIVYIMCMDNSKWQTKKCERCLKEDIQKLTLTSADSNLIDWLIERYRNHHLRFRQLFVNCLIQQEITHGNISRLLSATGCKSIEFGCLSPVKSSDFELPGYQKLENIILCMCDIDDPELSNAVLFKFNMSQISLNFCKTVSEELLGKIIKIWMLGKRRFERIEINGTNTISIENICKMFMLDASNNNWNITNISGDCAKLYLTLGSYCSFNFKFEIQDNT